MIMIIIVVVKMTTIQTDVWTRNKTRRLNIYNYLPAGAADRDLIS